MSPAALLLALACCPASAGPAASGLERAALGAERAAAAGAPEAALALAGESIDGGPALARPMHVRTEALGALAEGQAAARGTPDATGPAVPLPRRRPPSRLRALGRVLLLPFETPLAMAGAVGIWGAASGYSLLDFPVGRTAGSIAGGTAGAGAGFLLGALVALASFVPRLVRAVAKGR